MGVSKLRNGWLRAALVRRCMLSMACLACWLAGNAVAEQREVVLLTWADYLDPAVAADFEAYCDCRLEQVYYENDDARDTLMVESDGAGYDVILLNGLMLHTYQHRGWLARIDGAGVPNLHHVDPQLRTAFDAAEDHAVPYFWGTMGIGYREDLVGRPLRTWRDLLQPDESLQGRILMIDSMRDLLTAALKSLGASLNCTDTETLHAARDLLLTQKPHVKDYSYVSLDRRSALVTGDAAAAMLYSGDARMLQEFHGDIRFVLPEEGSLIWVDYLTISRHAANPDLALRLLDFLNRPEIAARNARYVHYATPNRAAKALLPASFTGDTVIYPADEDLRQSEYQARVPPRIERTYNEIFTAVVE
jgi:spermidine/putrescine transport system substrate-binding protein